MNFNHNITKILALTALSTIAITALDVRLKVVDYKIKSDKVNNKIKIALVTDLHSCKYGNKQKTLIDAINKAKPDLILLGGDILDDDVPDSNSLIFLKYIGEFYPCYYVTGNHELYTGNIVQILNTIRDYGIHVLNGCYDIVNVGKSKINICGIDDKSSKKFQRTYIGLDKQLQHVSKAVENNNFTVLLTHRPELIYKYLKYNFDLILAGHAHGGQWRIPYLINGVYAPNQGIFPKYAGGKYQFDTASFVVSRGLARESTRFVPRIFNRPELVMIEIDN